MKRFNLSEWAVTHRPMVLFLIITTLIVGGLSFSRLGRLEDPNFDVPQMTAIVVWPGATAASQRRRSAAMLTPAL